MVFAWEDSEEDSHRMLDIRSLPESERARRVTEIVTDDAPDVVAIVQEHGREGDPLNAWIAAWAMDFGDSVEIVARPSRARWRARSVDGARRYFDLGGSVRAYVVRPGIDAGTGGG